jgi:hypothetical protein
MVMGMDLNAWKRCTVDQLSFLLGHGFELIEMSNHFRGHDVVYASAAVSLVIEFEPEREILDGLLAQVGSDPQRTVSLWNFLGSRDASRDYSSGTLADAIAADLDGAFAGGGVSPRTGWDPGSEGLTMLAYGYLRRDKLATRMAR